MLWHDTNGFYLFMEDTVFQIRREEVCGVGLSCESAQQRKLCIDGIQVVPGRLHASNGRTHAVHILGSSLQAKPVCLRTESIWTGVPHAVLGSIAACWRSIGRVQLPAGQS